MFALLSDPGCSASQINFPVSASVAITVLRFNIMNVTPSTINGGAVVPSVTAPKLVNASPPNCAAEGIG